MYAIVETGGKQTKVTPGKNIDIEKLLHAKGEKVSLDKVLMLVTDKETKIGNPYIKGASVKGHILEEGKKDKIIVYKMRPKKGTRRKFGHRQWYSKIFIDSIELDGKTILKAELKEKTKKKKEE